MPFDGRENTPALNRARLIEALRAPMPENFEWDFRQIEKEVACGTAGCAMGLAKAMGLLGDCRFPCTGVMAKALGIDLIKNSQLENIFLSPRYCGVTCMEKVTSTMVADALERVA
jgi:hypothetical protein